MARLPRLDLPGIPQHVVQRGVNRTPCFVDETDRHVYREQLRLAAAKANCAIHAYVFMSNHVHLLACSDVAGGVSAMMQSLGRRYVWYFNRKYERTGTLFQGRFRSSLVQTERYFWTCHRYIELNPVRAGMTNAPAQHRWSSHRRNAFGEPDDLVTPHAEYLALGPTPADRQAAYRELFRGRLQPDELEVVRRHLNKDCALGSPEFQDRIESLVQRRARIVVPGRPRASSAKT